MTAFVTWGYNFLPNIPSPAAEAKKTEPEATPAKRVPFKFHIPGWIYPTVKYILVFGVVGLCITGIVFMTDFFEVIKGHEGFIPRPDHPIHDLLVYDSGNNDHHGVFEPEEWCGKHPGDCRWAEPQTGDGGMNPKASSDASSVLAPGIYALGIKRVILVLAGACLALGWLAT